MTHALPDWLQSTGTAKSSCQRIWRMVTDLDFQTRYALGQAQELIQWLFKQVQVLADSLKEVANRVARLEVLVYVLDQALASAEHQLLFRPQQSQIHPKPKPTKPSSSAPSPVRKNQKRQADLKTKKSGLRKLKELDARLKNFDTAAVLDKIHQLSAKVDELEDQLEKCTDKIQRLQKCSRNTERALRTNGLLLGGDFLSRSSESELD